MRHIYTRRYGELKSIAYVRMPEMMNCILAVAACMETSQAVIIPVRRPVTSSQ